MKQPETSLLTKHVHTHPHTTFFLSSSSLLFTPSFVQKCIKINKTAHNLYTHSRVWCPRAWVVTTGWNLPWMYPSPFESLINKKKILSVLKLFSLWLEKNKIWWISKSLLRATSSGTSLVSILKEKIMGHLLAAMINHVKVTLFKGSFSI